MINLVTFKQLTSGVGTFAQQLQKQTAGRLIRVSRTRRKFDGGYRTVHPADVTGPTLLLDTPKQGRAQECIDFMRNVPCALMIHDPRSLVGDKAEVVPYAKRVIVIRRRNMDLVPGAVFIPHPYTPRWTSEEAIREVPRKHACAHTRIDFDKKTHLIVQANRRLTAPYQVDIYGKINRMYVWAKHMEEQIKGPYPESGAELCHGYNFDVDLTQIEGDGEGTQYCYLEASDAGTVPIMWKSWKLGPEHCIEIDSVDELVSVLQMKHRPMDIVYANLRRLQEHTAVGQRYIDVTMEAS